MSRLLRYQIRELGNHARHWIRFEKPAWKRVLRSGSGTETYLYFSPGMHRIRHLAAFTDCDMLYLPCGEAAERVLAVLNKRVKGVVVWGVKEVLPDITWKDWISAHDIRSIKGLFASYLAYRKRKKAAQTIAFALNFASRHGLPLFRMEDGFLRSLDLGVHGAAPLSLFWDSCGMYYDATRSSDLELRLNSTWEVENPDAVSCIIKRICRYRLSKYNHAPDLDTLREARHLFERAGKKILVLDQTVGDVSIQLGLAGFETFHCMLESAIKENPDATIYLKVHPDVLGGAKQGHFDLAKLPATVVPIGFDVSPLSLLEVIDEVYTVTSQMGFEALLLGKPVHCFGMPFYAGWGLTIDRLKCERRTRKRSVLEVFCAAYICSCRYVSPVTGKRVSIEEIVELLRVQRDVNEQNAGYHACLGFKRWKHPHAKAFLCSTRGEVEFFTDAAIAMKKVVEKHGKLVIWASKVPAQVQSEAAQTDIPLLRMEDGFLRSVGLGSNFFRPGSLVLDAFGIYYDPANESGLERILSQERTPEELRLAERLRKALVERGISKYNLNGVNDLPNLPLQKRILLVPGQVEDDASVRLGGLGLASNLALLREVRLRNPDAYIIYKEHPDVVSGNRLGAVPMREANEFADCVLRTTPIEKVLSVCHEVHTLTSLTGFEALLRGLPVTTYGGPFYAGWGLTTDLHTFPRRKPLPSLDHLVAGALLLYPRYYDWESCQIVSCADFVDLLANLRTQAYT